MLLHPGPLRGWVTSKLYKANYAGGQKCDLRLLYTLTKNAAKPLPAPPKLARVQRGSQDAMQNTMPFPGVRGFPGRGGGKGFVKGSGGTSAFPLIP